MWRNFGDYLVSAQELLRDRKIVKFTKNVQNNSNTNYSLLSVVNHSFSKCMLSLTPQATICDIEQEHYTTPINFHYYLIFCTSSGSRKVCVGLVCGRSQTILLTPFITVTKAKYTSKVKHNETHVLS